MKFIIGSKVKVKNNLLVGMEYSNEDGTIFDNLNFRMKNHLGKEAIVVEILEGKYKLNIDKFFLYTDNMLEGIDEEIKPNLEVEEIVNELLKLIPEQLINDAIDKKDEKRFKELTNQYFLGI